MRADMAKVIVERPRHGRGLCFPRARLRDWGPIEESPRRQGMKRPWLEAGREKCLNENLAPLRRYLLSNVGRPWDKVFGEMSQHMRLDSAVQLHIWQHVQHDVCFDAIRFGGARSTSTAAVWRSARSFSSRRGRGCCGGSRSTARGRGTT